MKPTQKLHEMGQSLWLDNITRAMLDDGTLQGYIDELSVTGQTSNPTIFDKAISGGEDYDEQLSELQEAGNEPEHDLLRDRPDGHQARGEAVRARAPAHRPHGRLGLARGLTAARLRHAGDDPAGRRSARPRGGQQLHQDPGTPEGLPAIEESISPGCRSTSRCCCRRPDHGRRGCLHEGHRAAARGGPRPRRARPCSRSSSAAGTSPCTTRCPDEMKNTLGIAVGKSTYRPGATCSTPIAGRGWPRRVRGCSGCSSPAPAPRTREASDTLYVDAFAASDTINTMPDKTLHAFADHGEVGDPLPADGGRRR